MNASNKDAFNFPDKTVLNPFLPQDVFIADGEPHVFGDRLYLIGSHDREGGDSFCMEDYEFFSAPLADLSDWTSKGTNYSASRDPLYGNNAEYLYAPDVVQGNDGRYYLYYCLAGRKGKGGYSHPISVAVCDTPDGEYEYLGAVCNPDGSPYLDWVCFDPAVMNDNGVIRLYFGSGPFKNIRVRPWNAFILSKVYSGIYGKSAKDFFKKPGPLGANAAELSDDMITLKAPPKRICDTADFKGHAFFEGSSIRKSGNNYYFIYSSQQNHELCYAASEYPDKHFRFCGTLISNGDIGLNGRKARNRLNATGTTHGGIEHVNGQWYVFYHRLTHGSDYSRQACAEKLPVTADGRFGQAEMTSCGLNGGALPGCGGYPATACCNLTNGKMPHIANKKRQGLPMVTHEGNLRFVGGAAAGTSAVYKYFDLSEAQKVSVTARGTGILEVYFGNCRVGRLGFNSRDWAEEGCSVESDLSNNAITLKVENGTLDIHSFYLE